MSDAASSMVAEDSHPTMDLLGTMSLEAGTYSSRFALEATTDNAGGGRSEEAPSATNGPDPSTIRRAIAPRTRRSLTITVKTRKTASARKVAAGEDNPERLATPNSPKARPALTPTPTTGPSNRRRNRAGSLFAASSRDSQQSANAKRAVQIA